MEFLTSQRPKIWKIAPPGLILLQNVYQEPPVTQRSNQEMVDKGNFDGDFTSLRPKIWNMAYPGHFLSPNVCQESAVTQRCLPIIALDAIQVLCERLKACLLEAIWWHEWFSSEEYYAISEAQMVKKLLFWVFYAKFFVVWVTEIAHYKIW